MKIARWKAGKAHVTVDGIKTGCGSLIPERATVTRDTTDWHQYVNCYNCAYRLWPTHKPAGFIRPANGSDFPLRRECPHAPGRELDPQACYTCSPDARVPNWPCPNGCTDPHPRLARYTPCTVFPPLRELAEEERCPVGECVSTELAIHQANPRLFFDLADSASMYCYHCHAPVCMACQKVALANEFSLCERCW